MYAVGRISLDLEKSCYDCDIVSGCMVVDTSLDTNGQVMKTHDRLLVGRHSWLSKADIRHGMVLKHHE